MFGDDFFDQFFNAPQRQEKRSGEGSGFFISADGYILTNNHVVKDAVKVKIFNIDKEEFTAKIIGTDPKTDLALLKINVKNVPYIDLGDSSAEEVGEWVLAIGNPFGQDLTVTCRDHLGQGPAARAGPIRGFPADRRRHQHGQLGRAADQHEGRGHRHQFHHPDTQRRQHRHRLRHSRPTWPRRWWPT